MLPRSHQGGSSLSLGRFLPDKTCDTQTLDSIPTVLHNQLSHTSTGMHALKLNITPKIRLGEGHRYYSPSCCIKINPG